MAVAIDRPDDRDAGPCAGVGVADRTADEAGNGLAGIVDVVFGQRRQGRRDRRKDRGVIDGGDGDAAPEKLIEAVAASPLLFARAAYHLGNRHVPVQILPTDNGGKLRFQTDHVLAEMVKGLGCTVSETEAPFQPESGAYGGGHQHAGETDLHNPGHGPHRSVPKIHQFKPR